MQLSSRASAVAAGIAALSTACGIAAIAHVGPFMPTAAVEPAAASTTPPRLDLHSLLAPPSPTAAATQPPAAAPEALVEDAPAAVAEPTEPPEPTAPPATFAPTPAPTASAEPRETPEPGDGGGDSGADR